MKHLFASPLESNVPVYAVAAFLILLGVTLTEAFSLETRLGFEGVPLTFSTLTASVSGALRRRRGRPRKFAAPSKAVTLTLPETVLATLAGIDRDISKAIVGLTRRRAPKNGHAAAELSVFGRRAVITVEPSPTLANRTGIELVPLPDGRALIAFDQPYSIADLELLLDDGLDDPALPDHDRRLFESVRDILREARRSNQVTLLQRSIIVLERGKRPARSAARSSLRTTKAR